MKKLIFIILFLLVGFAPKADAAIYYIDCVNGNNANTGLGTTTALAWADWDQFTDNARSAGDMAFVRRGGTGCDDGTDLTFTTDGTLNNPIVLSADYDNLWSDFATSSQTYTVTQGSVTMTGSATITGIAAGDWVYVYGDCTEDYNSPTVKGCDFAYEVASVSGTTLTLYLPYKGMQTGAGNSLRVMPDAPVWNITTGDFNFNMSQDDYWYFKGLQINSTDSAGNIAYGALAKGLYIMDVIFATDDTTASWTGATDTSVFFNKVRGEGTSGAGFSGGGNFKDIYGDCVGDTGTIFSVTTARAYIIGDTIIPANCGADIIGSTVIAGSLFNVRNYKREGVLNTITGTAYNNYYLEDDFGVPGLNTYISNKITSDAVGTTTMSTTTNLRSGGGAKNLVVFPPSGTGNTGLSTKMFPHSYIKLFEYPVYTDTSSKTYTMYFNSTSTSNWTNDPTVEEMWIECEYYATASNANRVLKKSSQGLATSTAALDFNGSTGWQSISVTCQPAQSGVLYIRGWYGKPKETPTNWFYMDITPVVTN